MNISFNGEKISDLTRIKNVQYGAVFIDLVDKNVYIKIDEPNVAVNLASGRTANFGENYWARVLNNSEYSFRIFYEFESEQNEQ